MAQKIPEETVQTNEIIDRETAMDYSFPMRLHRFFVDADLSRSSLKITDPELLHQWSKVLRLQEEDRVTLCDGNAMEAIGTLQSIDHDHATVALASLTPVAAEPKKYVTLYCSILKRENFEWIVQKCIEIGVKVIVPIITARTIKTGLKIDRLRTIAKEAAEQSGRGIIPKISEPIDFISALSEAKNSTNIFFHTAADALPTPNPLPPTPYLNIWIGPEGGWTEKEVQEATNNGFHIASLGMLTLRAETAAVIGSYRAVEGIL
ncbi:MAG: 16S rRNA (uracil1498-N3)-methyltransferase [Candidatus Peregrinibacteria bacterium Greene1014_49]|nr:MAG: 16S rRNA (uracil1498-N3)-methyltransferase [Candidatus Peregrinibacteria bacterium Greene1014_49]